MKLLSLCFFAFFLIGYSLKRKEIKESVETDLALSERVKFSLGPEISKSKASQIAVARIDQIDTLEEKAKKGEYKELEEKITDVYDKIKREHKIADRLDFRELLGLYIKYFIKEDIQDNPRSLFTLVNYRPSLYKDFLLAIQYGLSPNYDIEKSSTILQLAIKENY